MKNLNFKVLSTLLFLIIVTAGCGKTGPGIDAIGTWGGSELAAFQKMADSAGIDLKFETTRDLDAVLAARIEAGNLPDIAVLPNPSKLKELARKGVIKPLSYLDRTELEADFNKTFLELGSYAGSIYGIAVKAANKSVIWYNPEMFHENGWTVPGSWDELQELSKKIRKSGKMPWSIGADIGWPLSDWVENIMARTAGPDLYDKWIYHEIKWTDPAVRKAFTVWSDIMGDPANLEGGIDGTLASSFQNAAFSVFKRKPKAFLYYEGDFMGAIISSQLTNIVFGKNMDFFEFPPIVEKYGTPVIIGADIVVVFNDKPAVRKFMKFLISADSVVIAAGNGFLSPDNRVPLDSYEDPALKKSAAMLRKANTLVFDASDLMPPAVGNQGGFWDACKRYVQDEKNLDSILSDMETLAEKNY